jgi:hypothetical protein
LRGCAASPFSIANLVDGGERDAEAARELLLAQPEAAAQLSQPLADRIRTTRAAHDRSLRSFRGPGRPLTMTDTEKQTGHRICRRLLFRSCPREVTELLNLNIRGKCEARIGGKRRQKTVNVG